MIEKELKRSHQMAPINVETSMITNLQNMKQGLKQNYNNAELLNTILNLDLTEQLIEEHLNLS